MNGFDLQPLTSEALSSLAPAALFSLEGKVAVVTGASGGMGEWIAAGLAAAGGSVLMTDRPGAPLAESSEKLQASGCLVETLALDLLDGDAPQAIIKEALDRFGRIDVLVNNAGVNRREPIFEVTRESWDLIAAIDLRVPYELSRAAARAMARGGGGSIVHIASLNNAIGLDGVSVYGAHKAALCQLSKSQSVEWVRLGIRSNAVCPGFMLTPLSKPLWDDPVRGEWLVERSLMKRPGYPRELVGICQLLASDAGSFITGQTVYVEGGWLAGTSWDQAAFGPGGSTPG